MQYTISEQEFLGVFEDAKSIEDAVTVFMAIVKDDGIEITHDQMYDTVMSGLDFYITRHEQPWFSDAVKAELKAEMPDLPLTKAEVLDDFFSQWSDLEGAAKYYGGAEKFAEMLAEYQLAEAYFGADRGYFNGAYETRDFLRALRRQGIHY